MTSKRDLEEQIELLDMQGMWALMGGNRDRYFDLQRECLVLKQEKERRFPPPQAIKAEAEKRPKVSEARLRAWLQNRVENWPSGKPYPSLNADWTTAKEELGYISRDLLQSLRNKIVPADWRRVGRRTKTAAGPEQQRPKKTREPYSRK